MFNPGETVSHQFIIPFVADELSKVIVSYKQDGDIVFEKTVTSGFDSIEEGKTRFIVALSQEESLMFRDDCRFFVQINVYVNTNGNELRATSKPIRGNNGVQYHREVISDE